MNFLLQSGTCRMSPYTSTSSQLGQSSGIIVLFHANVSKLHAVINVEEGRMVSDRTEVEQRHRWRDQVALFSTKERRDGPSLGLLL